MNIKIQIHNRNLGVRKKSLKTWKISEEEKKNILKFLEDLELGKVNKGKKISEQRQLKYLDILKIPLTFFKKSMKQLEVKDMEKFEKNLSSDKIQSFKKTPYKHNTKIDIRSMLRTYLKWRLGDTPKFRKLTDWLDTKQIKKTPDYLPEQEVDKLYKNCKNPSERFFIAVLFDSGARAEEFHNIRFEDIQLPENNESFVKLTLKEEYSKTEGRVISLYWKHSLEAIRDFIKERTEDGIKSNEVLFKNSYDNMRQVLNRLGKKVLNRPIHYHLFRHSSATYYATKLNRQELCYRYGWKFNTDMVDIYISRAGMVSKELDSKFESTRLEEVQKQIEKERFMRESEMESFRKETSELKQLLLKEIFDGIKTGKYKAIMKDNEILVE